MKIPSYIDDEDIIHVVPENDLKEHSCHRTECWCKPDLIDDSEIDGGYIVVHHSMDRREEYEEGRKLS